MPVHNPDLYCYSSVWALPRSLATTCGITVVFSSCGYLDVSVPHVSLRMTMDSSYGTRFSTSGGFPHSEIHGSMAICASPWLIAACHVLLRLLVPRHSPYALYSLIHFDLLSDSHLDFVRPHALIILFQMLHLFAHLLSQILSPGSAFL